MRSCFILNKLETDYCKLYSYKKTSGFIFYQPLLCVFPTKRAIFHNAIFFRQLFQFRINNSIQTRDCTFQLRVTTSSTPKKLHHGAENVQKTANTGSKLDLDGRITTTQDFVLNVSRVFVALLRLMMIFFPEKKKTINL